MSLDYPIGATPLDPDEIAGLIPRYITTQGELNLLEQQNIIEARAWAMEKKHRDILSDIFIRNLHKRMFKNVWKWAGKYRKSDKSIGVCWTQVPEEVHKLCSDTNFWIQNKSYVWDELAARFHHRLVKIHPFPNGNGRHSRLLTDILMMNSEQQPLTWGAGTGGKDTKLEAKGDARTTYINALRDADQNRFDKLILFIRS
ncbi:MAG: mobile mystery protein B [Oligoflexia bacterium]|nr:mobile mystery protein B [Oligoflexia bacterium]